MNRSIIAALLHKEWLLHRRAAALALACSYFAFAWYFAAALLEYLALAPQLAQLQNRRGATDMLLGAANDFLKWLWVLWSIFFAARPLAQERQWQTLPLFYGLPAASVVAGKALFLLLLFLLLALPFWLAVLFLSSGVDWDRPLLAAQALAQLFFMLYALLLGLCFSSWNRQSLSASLGCALAWLLLWLLPSLGQQPPPWDAWLQYLSPFEHFALLQRGVIGLQSLFYFGSSLILGAALSLYFWLKAQYA